MEHVRTIGIEHQLSWLMGTCVVLGLLLVLGAVPTLDASQGTEPTAFVCSSSPVRIELRPLQALSPEGLPKGVRVQEVPDGRTAIGVYLDGKSVGREFIRSSQVDRTVASPIWKQPRPVALVATADAEGVLHARLYALVSPPAPDRAQETIHGPRALVQLSHVARPSSLRRYPGDTLMEARDFLAWLAGVPVSAVLDCDPK
jgi:hypothetical protein